MVDVIEVLWIKVIPEYRGRGLARHLLEYVKKTTGKTRLTARKFSENSTQFLVNMEFEISQP